MELLILLFILIVALFYFIGKPVAPVVIPPNRSEVIEDTSYLKADLARVKEELQRAYIDRGVTDSHLKEANLERQKLAQAMTRLQEQHDKVVSQKKSGEVRLGHVSEQLIPMLPEFPVPIETLKFFGNPIDYISIDMDKEMISFIEVKSGGSTLSDKQKKIRKMVQDKRIQFFEVRIDDKGVKIK